MRNSLDTQYQSLLREVLNSGIDKSDRTGTGTRSVFGKTIRHDMSKGFPILTTKRVAWKTLTTELKWFLRGDTNIKYLVDNNCHIWDGDAYKAYKANGGKLESQEEFIEKIKGCDDFAAKWGNLGPIYGEQWRKATAFGGSVDQIRNLIRDLKENPDSRRHIVNSWNLGELKYMTLPPCHYGFQCYVADNKLSLMWQQRSADLFLGVPFNISSYGLLLLLLCEETGYEPGELIGNFGDVHLYSNHFDQALIQLERDHFPLPTVELEDYKSMLEGDFRAWIVNYLHHPTIKAPLSN